MAATVKQWRDKKMTWKVYEAQQLGLELDRPKNQLNLFDEQKNQELCQKVEKIEAEKQERLGRTMYNLLLKGAGN